MPSQRPALLVLSTGERYRGVAFGSRTTGIGEVCFNTSMTGYQEILTDPSYAGQIVVMTSAHIGNYGVNAYDVESGAVQPTGFVVRELARRPSNHRSEGTVDRYLADAGVPGIAGVDTRALTRRLRDGGAVMGLIAHDVSDADLPRLREQLAAAPDYGSIDYVARVSSERPQRVLWDDQAEGSLRFVAPTEAPAPRAGAHVVVIDYGVKYSILRNLLRQGLDVTTVPSDASAELVLAHDPGAVLLSNGPGDPAGLPGQVAVVKSLLGQKPIFGICLGHQLLGQALGAKTFKLKFGHRGANQPVLDKRSERVAITSQNHGYAVSAEGLDEAVRVTEFNLNDRTVEGLRHDGLDAESVQYHPEAGPGPHDAAPFFRRLAERVRATAS
jgi:carbamoyl-phosphate synthase small subunit